MGAVVQSLRKNLAANFLSRVWIGVLQIATLPYLLELLGPQGFGLVGVFLTLQSIAGIFEGALSLATNREIAQRRAADPSATKDILPMHAVAGLCCGIVLAAAVILLAPFLASYWISGDGLPQSVIVNALILMGCALGLQVASGSAFGALLGCDRQIVANIILAAWATLRTAGALAALFALGGNPHVYFAAQLAGFAIYAILTFAMAIRAAGWSLNRAIWRIEELRDRVRTVSSMIGSGLVGTPLEQLDKIALAHWGGLANLGYYAFASNLAGTVLYVAGPVVQASYPALAASVGQSNKRETDRVFNLMTAVVTVAAGSIALILSLFGHDIVGLWTGNAETGATVGRLLPFLMTGAAANAVFYLPVYLQLTTGRTKPLIVFNAAALAVMAPLMFVLVTHFGASGAAVGWLTIKIAALAFLVPVILRPLVTGGAAAWWLHAILPPVLGILPGAIVGYGLIGADGSALSLVIGAGLATLTSLIGGVLCAPELRQHVLLALSRGR